MGRLLSEFGITNASAQCIGYQEAVDMVTLGEVYKSSQLVIVSLRVCSGPQQTRSFYRVSDRAEISTRSVPYLSWFALPPPPPPPLPPPLHPPPPPPPPPLPSPPPPPTPPPPSHLP